MSGGFARPQRHAVVVFADRAECAWLRLLEPGFRHCFAALREQGGWLIFDPLLDRIELAWVPPERDFDLPSFYAAQGHTVIAGVTRHPETRARLLRPTPLTCVTAVKRLLGVDAAGVLTPWQLYRHLTGRESYVVCGFRPYPGKPGPHRHGSGRAGGFALDSMP